MPKIIELSSADARAHFLKGSSYFNGDFPNYISFELIHPALYVSLVNALTEETNWNVVRTRMATFEGGVVECCSAPVASVDHQTDVAAQIQGWWQAVEQRSLAYSLEYRNLAAHRRYRLLWRALHA